MLGKSERTLVLYISATNLNLKGLHVVVWFANVERH